MTNPSLREQIATLLEHDCNFDHPEQDVYHSKVDSVVILIERLLSSLEMKGDYPENANPETKQFRLGYNIAVREFNAKIAQAKESLRGEVND